LPILYLLVQALIFETEEAHTASSNLFQYILLMLLICLVLGSITNHVFVVRSRLSQFRRNHDPNLIKVHSNGSIEVDQQLKDKEVELHLTMNPVFPIPQQVETTRTSVIRLGIQNEEERINYNSTITALLHVPTKRPGL
jgi:hypothetical protein